MSSSTTLMIAMGLLGATVVLLLAFAAGYRRLRPAPADEVCELCEKPRSAGCSTCVLRRAR